MRAGSDTARTVFFTINLVDTLQVSHALPLQKSTCQYHKPL